MEKKWKYKIEDIFSSVYTREIYELLDRCSSWWEKWTSVKFVARAQVNHYFVYHLRAPKNQKKPQWFIYLSYLLTLKKANGIMWWQRCENYVFPIYVTLSVVCYTFYHVKVSFSVVGDVTAMNQSGRLIRMNINDNRVDIHSPTEVNHYSFDHQRALPN